MIISISAELVRKRSLDKVFKCIKPVHPRAEIAVLEKKSHILKFKYWRKDDKLTPRETGYLSVGGGDSGGPIWTVSRVMDELTGMEKERMTLVGVMLGSPKWFGEAEGSFLDDIEYQCRIFVTKITEDFVRWIKHQAKIT